MIQKLHVFRGAFSIAAAVAVLGDRKLDSAAIRAEISKLKRASVVGFEISIDGDRYYRFKEPRQSRYRAGKRVTEKYFYYMASWTEWIHGDLRARGDDSFMRMAELYLDNIRAALHIGFSNPKYFESTYRILCATHLFWYFTSHTVEGIAWFQKAVDTIDSVENIWQIRIYNGFGTLLADHGDLDAALNSLQVAYEGCQRLNNEGGKMSILGNMARVLRHQGRLTEAYEAYRENILYLERMRNTYNLASSYATFLGLLCEMDRFDEAAQVMKDSLTLRESFDFESIFGVLQFNIAIFLQKRGHWEAAEQAFCEQLKQEWKRGPSHATSRNLRLLAMMLFSSASYYRGAAILGISQKVAELCGSSLTPHDITKSIGSTEEARKSLGDEAFDDAWEYGYGLAYEDSLSFILRISSV